MDCRPQCGACCIAPAIRQPFFGMPDGKPAGVACLHLLDNAQCDLYGDPRRPAVCDQFKPEPAVCGESRTEALALLSALEQETAV